MGRRSITDEENDKEEAKKDIRMLYPYLSVYPVYHISVLLVFMYLTKAGGQYHGASDSLHTHAIYTGQL